MEKTSPEKAPLLLLFSQTAELFSTQRLQTEALNLGLELQLFDRQTNLSKLLEQNQKRQVFILPRLGLLNLEDSLIFLEDLECQTKKQPEQWRWLTDRKSYSCLKSKWHTYEFLKRHEIETIPSYRLVASVTYDEHKNLQLKNILQKISADSSALYLKPSYSLQGYGTIRIELDKNTDLSLQKVIQHLKSNDNKYYQNEWVIQPSLNEQLGYDIRFLFLNHEFIGSFSRKNTDDPHYRSNAHLGGVANPYRPTKEDLITVTEIQNFIKREFQNCFFYSLDFLIQNKQIILNEINVSPGFSAAEKALNMNIAELIVKKVLTISKHSS